MNPRDAQHHADHAGRCVSAGGVPPRKVRPEPHRRCRDVMRWQRRRPLRPNIPFVWEVACFYESFDEPRP
jgi:hypothetical protein